MRTSALRLSVVYAAIFAAALLALVFVIYLLTARFIDTEVDAAIERDTAGFLEAYARGGVRTLAAELTLRSENWSRTNAVYLLTDSQGFVLAGNLPAWPTMHHDNGPWVDFVISVQEGGVEIEKVAHETPEKIHRAAIDPLTGAQPYQGRELAFKLGLKGDQVKQFVDIFLKLAKLFQDKDLALLEVNPLVITKAGNLHCLDAKINIDGNAMYRQKALREMHDPSQEDPREVHAAQWEINYVALGGDIGCMVNGAGLAMGTMDIIKLHGGAPANFLDVGGGATKERVSEAFKIILSDASVKAVLVNIFGGIVRCDLIAEGIIGAVSEVGVKVPVVVRLEGNNAPLGSKMLAESGLNIIAANSLKEAAEAVVKAAKG